MTPAWSEPLRQPLPGGRLHMQHGPIDLVLRAWGAEAAMRDANEAAFERFRTILPELAGELRELRRPMSERPRVETPVARRMVAACRPHREFVTPMAAVAGAVADEVLAAMTDVAPLDRAFVNDGGDIAVHLTEGESLSVAIAADFARGPVPAVNGALRVAFEDRVGGIATSGAQGRSFSLGIADSVTVLARDAASADAAATLIANAVDLPGHPAVTRRPASSLDPDSDLRDRLVTTGVGPLSRDEIEAALRAGLERAAALRAAGLVRDAAVVLRGSTLVLGPLARIQEIAP